jgi:hypothetical protein
MEFLGLYGLDLVVTLAFAFIFYKAGEIENQPALVWGGLSVIVSLVTRIMGFGLLPLIVAQVFLYFAIALVRFLVSIFK